MSDSKNLTETNDEVLQEDIIKAYYRLAIQVSVSTSLLLVYTVLLIYQQGLEQVIFLILLLSGHITGIFAPPKTVKYVAGGVTASAGIAAFAFAPSGITLFALIGGVTSGVSSFSSVGLKNLVSFTQTLENCSFYRLLDQISQLLEQLDWKRKYMSEFSVKQRIRRITQNREIDYIKKTQSGKVLMSLSWTEDFQTKTLKFEPESNDTCLLNVDKRVIEAYIEYYFKLFRYARLIMISTTAPIYVVESLLREPPLLMEMYRKPQEFIKSDQFKDDYDKWLEEVLNIPKSLMEYPKRPDTPVFSPLLFYYQSIKDPNAKELKKAAKANKEKWRNFQKYANELFQSSEDGKLREEDKADLKCLYLLLIEQFPNLTINKSTQKTNSDSSTYL